MSAEAPPLSSSSTNAWWPPRTASCSAVFPWRFTAFSSAALCSHTTLPLPSCSRLVLMDQFARCSGVALCSVRALTSAPWRISRAASGERPCSAATCSGVKPPALQLFTPRAPACRTDS
ncbi:hypothetical protein EYF80_037678 [Liparis tanakae]|uniref:Uncharacterized protein n=1 Tax=Liparis tanakae TaxID=230148 RepID=A0A4Z2GFG3_9TELE|nr:hypothetical protein EYF80_037678 [Liparis tanakae]